MNPSYTNNKRTTVAMAIKARINPQKMIRAGMGMSGRKPRLCTYAASKTSVVGINLVIRASPRKSDEHGQLMRPIIRVAARNVKNKLIGREVRVGPRLDSHHTITGNVSIYDSWSLATRIYCNHMGVPRPRQWMSKSYLPGPRQFYDLMVQMQLAGIDFSDQEIEWIRAIKRR